MKSDGSYDLLLGDSGFISDLEYFFERYPEKKSAIENCFKEFYHNVIERNLEHDKDKDQIDIAIEDFRRQIQEIAEVEIRSVCNTEFFLNKEDQRKNFIMEIDSSPQIEKIKLNLQKTQSSEDSQNPIPSTQFSRTQGVLYLGDGNAQVDITRTNQSAFTLQEIGKKIKGDSRRLRFSANKLDIESAGKSFFQENEAPEFTSLLSPPLVPLDQEFAISNKSNIYQFNLELSADKKTRLYSIQSKEELLEYKIMQSSQPASTLNIEFFKGDDGFYYAKANQNCSISYRVGFDQSRYLALAQGNTFIAQDFGGSDSVDPNLQKAINILNEYQGQDHFKFSVKSDEYTLPEFTDKTNFAQDLYTLPNQGSCSHRTFAIAYQFEKEGLKNGKDYRIINIEKTHVLIELKGSDGKFYQVDLGSEEVQMEIQTQNPSQALIPAISTKLNQSLQTQTTLEKVDNIQDLNQVISIKAEQEIQAKNILVQTSNIDDFVNYALQTSSSKTPAQSTAQATSNIFYIDSPQDLKIQANNLQIADLTTDSSLVEISRTTPFAKFLQQASQNHQNNYQLLVNWEKFTPNQRVAFNSLFDSGNRSVNQQAIPDNVQIIAVEKPKEIKDPSVLSRFDQKITLSAKLKKAITEELQRPSSLGSSSQTQTPQTHSFDLEGNPDWQGKIFGKIKLNGDNLIYQKSDFVKFLEGISSASSYPLDTKTKIEFKNIDEKNALRLFSLLSRAKAQGFIDYHGQKINFPKNLEFSINEKQFDFASLSQSSLNPSSSISSSAHSVTTDFVLTSPQELQSLTLVNKSDFEKLLVQVKIPPKNSSENSSESSGETYQELPGLIEDASKQADKSLSLLITSELSINQWYLLLKKAQENSVQLDLKIAKGVKIPENAELKSLLQITQFSPETSPSHQSPESTETPSSKRIFIVDDSSKFIKTNVAQFGANPFQEAIIVDIEEQGFDALFGKRDFKISESKDGKQSFAVYKESNGLEDILIAHPDKKIILRGEFDDSTIQLLTEKMLSNETKYQNLYFVFEDKNLAETELEVEPKKLSTTALAFLDPKFYQEEVLKPRVEEGASVKGVEVTSSRNNKPIIREEIPAMDTFYNKSDKQITETSEDFKTQRKALIEQQLQDNKMLVISGSAGVGKSYFMTSLAKEQNHQIYFGKEKIKDWAKSAITGVTKDKDILDDGGDVVKSTQSNPQKLSILVIDEYNVDGSTNYLMFRDLDGTNGEKGKKFLYHQGEVLELQDHHRVVFMGNSLEYGNRFKQKLFEKTSIQEVELKDFPSEYIYEELIKKPIFGETANTEITGEFKAFCQQAITDYKASNQGGVDAPNLKSKVKPQTVRELQEKILGKLSKTESPNPQTTKISSQDFIETSATGEICQKLSEAIQIRKHQFSQKISSSCVGTPGFIIEGDAGIGKSVMIEAILKQQNITEVKSLEELELQRHEQQQSPTQDQKPQTQQQHYYKINASNDIEKIKKDLIKAYELGVIVVFDEINAKIQEGGLEQIINDLLTNQHPEKKAGNTADPTSHQSATATKAGFMLIGSINSVASAGRAQLSPAIQSRCNYEKAKSLKEYSEDDLKEIIEHWKKNAKSEVSETRLTNWLSSLELEPSPSSLITSDTAENLAKYLKNSIQDNPNISLRDLKKILLKPNGHEVGQMRV